MVEFYTSIAKKWHERRWFVAQLFALAVAVILISGALSAPRVARIALLVADPFAIASSGILLACVGFHPVHGYLWSYRPTNALLYSHLNAEKLPALLRSSMASLLSAWLFCGFMYWLLDIAGGAASA
jgi:hypothetical protein